MLVVCSNSLLQVVIRTQVQEPQPGDPAWGQRNLVAVLMCTGHNGHWLTYCHHNGQWYCVDTAAAGRVVQANPFRRQGPNSLIHYLVFRG